MLKHLDGLSGVKGVHSLAIDDIRKKSLIFLEQRANSQTQKQGGSSEYEQTCAII